MLQQDRVHTLRQTHTTVATLMPLITAGLTVTGAVIAAIEMRRAPSARDDQPESGAQAETQASASGPSARPTHGAAFRPRAQRTSSARRYIATLTGRLLLVLLGVALVLAITLAATSTGRVGQAVTITALILLTLYLVEKVARQA